MLNAYITLKVNMTKVDNKQVRKIMADNNIVPEHLHVDWLHLTIAPSYMDNRYVLRAERTAHGTMQPSIVIKPEQLVTIFHTLFLSPTLPTQAYMELINLVKPQVLTLDHSAWKDYVRAKYPKYF